MRHALQTLNPFSFHAFCMRGRIDRHQRPSAGSLNSTFRRFSASVSTAANLTVRDLPDPLYKKLKSQAYANRRSIASEVTVLLERALEERATAEEDLLQRAERLRDRTPTRLTEEKRQEAVRRGRAWGKLLRVLRMREGAIRRRIKKGGENGFYVDFVCTCW